MRPTRVVLLLIVASLLLTVASTGKSRDKNSLRYDGVYQAQKFSTGFLYLRFYPDGHVVVMDSDLTPEKVASFISRNQPDLPQGDYRLEGSKITFTTKAQAGGEVHYDGTINEGGILFHIHFLTSGDHQFVFRAVKFPTTPEPLKNG